MESKQIPAICEAALDKKAEDIVIMKMADRSSLCDFFVVMSASSSVRVKAIVDHIEDTMNQKGYKLRHKEGYQDASWVLLDYGEVIAHIFHESTRKFYDLENLWGDAPRKSYIKNGSY